MGEKLTWPHFFKKYSNSVTAEQRKNKKQSDIMKEASIEYKKLKGNKGYVSSTNTIVTKTTKRRKSKSNTRRKSNNNKSHTRRHKSKSKKQRKR